MERELLVRFRVDGVLQEVIKPPKRYQNSIVSRVKVMGQLNIAEKRLPQDGRIRIKLAGRDIDIRLSTIPTTFGERIVMRLLDKSATLLDLAEIGMGPQTLAGMESVIKRSHGIILVTGPTGSGKTTTLYGALSKINTPGPEHPHRRGSGRVPAQGHRPDGDQPEDRPDASPRACAPSSARTRTSSWWARSATRRRRRSPSRPRSPATWCSPRCTPTTRRAPSPVWWTWAWSPSSWPRSLTAILAQRLVRRVCPDCRVQYTPTDDELKELTHSRASFKERYGVEKIYKAAGLPQLQPHRLPRPHRHLRVPAGG